MVEEDRYCIDILTQLGAVTTALESVAFRILDDHVQHCVAGALASGDAAEPTRRARSSSTPSTASRRPASGGPYGHVPVPGTGRGRSRQCPFPSVGARPQTRSATHAHPCLGETRLGAWHRTWPFGTVGGQRRTTANATAPSIAAQMAVTPNTRTRTQTSMTRTCSSPRPGAAPSPRSRDSPCDVVQRGSA